MIVHTHCLKDMEHRVFRLLALIFLHASDSSCARILASIFSPSYSHQVAFRPLWTELANRGHHITLLTTDPMKPPDYQQKNIKQIDLSQSYNIMENYGNSESLSKKRSEGTSQLSIELDILDALDKLADWQLGTPEVKSLIQNRSERFDLVMVEVMNPVHIAFAERFKAPFIGVTPQDAPYRLHALLGNYLHPTVYPDQYLPFARPLDFQQRVISTLFNWLNWYYQYFWRYPQQTLIARKHFGQEIRELYDIEKDMSLLFVNVNPIFHEIRPVGMNTIFIGGGTNLDPPRALPKEFQEFLESSGRLGVIYFSLGSNVKSSLITERLRNVILSTFARLPYKILWKFESSLDWMPENVKIIKWAPQRDLLANPKIKLFITQCGLQSLEEAIVNEVPMVCMPFMWDQPNNAKILERKGLGLAVDIMNISQASFTETIMEVIKNPLYKKNVIEVSKLTKDVERTGLERAVWWTEYCLRTGGAKHFKSPITNMPVYQFYLLDVFGSLFIACAVFALLTVLVLKCFWRLLSRNHNKETN